MSYFKIAGANARRACYGNERASSQKNIAMLKSITLYKVHLVYDRKMIGTYKA